MTKIEQLESEIIKVINELKESLNTRYLLRERLKSNTNTPGAVENPLEVIEVYIKYSNEYISMLKQENRRLQLSCDEWMKRAIELEFEALSARDAEK